MKKTCKLAIVIPCWNVGKYIAETLSCLQHQTFLDWRAICVDDDSVDETAEIIQKYTEQDQRIEYVRREGEKGGAQVCRNQGFALTTGAEYVIFFDADDIVANYCLEQRVNHMERYPNLDFSVFPAMRCYNEPYDNMTEIWGYDYLNDAIRCFLNRTLMMVGWTNIYKRQSIVDYNLRWDENVLSLQDADWNVQAILSGMHFDYASKSGAKVDYFWRIVDNGISSKIRTTKHFDSHVYHINKTLHSLTPSQLVLYDLDIQGCIKVFAFMLMQSPSSFKKLLQIDWFNTHRWLKYRLMFSFFIGGRGQKKFYPKITRYHNQVVRGWKNFQEEIIKEIKVK